MTRAVAVGGQRGHGPPPASEGDSRSVAPRSKLARLRNGRPSTPVGGRVRDPATAADAASEHPREPSGEPVQTDLAKGKSPVAREASGAGLSVHSVRSFRQECPVGSDAKGLHVNRRVLGWWIQKTVMENRQ